MPEGPEIALEADKIRAALEGQPIEAIRFSSAPLAGRARALEGQGVRAVRARGKAMLIHFDNDLTIYSHNQLYGKWFVRPRGVRPTTNRQLRLAIETPRSCALLYSASEIAILDPDECQAHPYLSKLGPDALDPETTVACVEDRLTDPRFARRRIGGILLDQSFVAGIGNYLRSEICFEARVDPLLRPADLDAAATRRLARATLVMARRAYRTRGITFSPKRAQALRKKGDSFGRVRHWVFARDGEPCRTCQREIVRRDLAGRRIYTCPKCQPGPTTAEGAPS
jgi:endonuclease-8